LEYLVTAASIYLANLVDRPWQHLFTQYIKPTEIVYQFIFEFVICIVAG